MIPVFSKNQTFAATSNGLVFKALGIAGLRFLCLFLFLAAPAYSPVYAETKTARGYFEEAREALLRGDFETAIDRYQSAIAKNPDYTAAYYGMAKAYFAIEDWHKSIERYKQVLKRDKEHLSAQTGLALAYLQVGQYTEAHRLLSHVQAQNPGNPENNYVLGVFFYKQGNLELAKSYFQKTTRLSPSHLRSWLGLARIAYEQEDYDDARVKLDRASTINPDHPEIYLLRGHIALALAFRKQDPIDRSYEFSKAREHFLAAAHLNPNRISLQLPLILLDLMEGHLPSAYERSLRLLAQNPGSIYLLGLHAFLSLKQDREKEAVQSLKQALRKDPTDSLLRYKLEQVLEKRRNRYPAELRRLSVYHLLRAKWHYRKFHFPLFRLHLDRALKLNPFCQQCSRLARNYALRSGDLEHYIRTLRKQIQNDPNSPRLRLRLERALSKNHLRLIYKFRTELFADSLEPPDLQIQRFRTPILVYVFDPKTPLALSYHIDAPALFSRALSAGLRTPGSVEAVSEAWRSTLESRIDQSPQTELRLPFLYPYRPQYLKHLRVVERRYLGKDPMHRSLPYVVSGRLTSSSHGIEVSLRLIEKDNATIIAKRRFEASGRDALTSLVAEATTWIRSALPVRGQILRKVSEDVLVNLGSYDGLSEKRRLEVRRFGKKRATLVVVETNPLLSRARIEKGSLETIDPGDTVLLLPQDIQKTK